MCLTQRPLSLSGSLWELRVDWLQVWETQFSGARSITDKYRRNKPRGWRREDNSGGKLPIFLSQYSHFDCPLQIDDKNSSISSSVLFKWHAMTDPMSTKKKPSLWEVSWTISLVKGKKRVLWLTVFLPVRGALHQQLHSSRLSGTTRKTANQNLSCWWLLREKELPLAS